MLKLEIENLFKEKIISFDLGGQETLALMDIKEEEIHGRLFLKGTIPPESTNNNWVEGLSASISFDDITSYIMFDTLDDYILRLKLSE